MAHLTEGSSFGPTKIADTINGPVIEIIQLPQSVIVNINEIRSLENSKLIQSNLGMCMTLLGIPAPQTNSNIIQLNKCILLAGFESGHVILLIDGQLIQVIDHCLGQFRPVISSGLRPLAKNRPDLNMLIVLGGPDVDDEHNLASTTKTSSLSFIQLNFSHGFVLEKINQISCLDQFQSGVSSFNWRLDGKLLAIGQWNGQISLVQTWEKSTSLNDSSHHVYKFKYLGSLVSLGALNDGTLLGDWSSITISAPHGPNVDQKSRIIRSVIFDSMNNYLITSLPAIGGANGSLLIWDLYRN